MKLLLTVLLSLLVIISTPTVANGCFPEEGEALLTFKTGLHDPGNLMSSWHDSDCCNWSGVTCDNLTKHVVELKLRNPYDNFGRTSHALTGEIKPALLHLRYLTHLDLSNNNFSYLTIPKFIATFENLVYLNLSYSWFQGPIPFELGNLSRLQFLDLSNSNFIGMVPPQLGNLSDHKYLSLANSYFFSNTPVISSLSWLYRLSNLRYLDMTYVGLNNGVDWPSINKMHLLETLILSGCELSKLPIDLSPVNLTSLTKLDLSNNNFHDTLPNRLWNLTGLLYLDLGYSDFHGSFPRALSNLVSLNYLRLGGNYFDHVFLEPISKLQNLRTLDLKFLNIGGNIVNLIKSLGRIWYNLENVPLRGNNLSWIGKQLQNLVVLQLRSNKFSGFIPLELGELPYLHILDIAHNSLVGPLPSFVCKFSGVDNNSLVGFSIVFGDGILYTVTLHIDINGQQYYASLPLEFATNIDISGNNLSGHIPEEMWLLDSVMNLNLSNNCFIGKIPETIGSMRSLKSLDLSFNNFSGQIPQALSSLYLLHNLNLSYNNFSRNIPTGRQLDTLSNPSIYTRNPYLCGPPIHKSCFKDQTNNCNDFARGGNAREMVWLFVISSRFYLGILVCLGSPNFWKYLEGGLFPIG